MIRDRKDYPSFYTPRGEAIFPALDKPDYKFKKENGGYHARLRFDPTTPGLDELIKVAEEIRDEAYEAKKTELEKAKKGALLRKLEKAPVIKEEEDPETGDLIGKVILRASLTAHVKIKNGPRAGEEFDKKPDIFDARGKQIRNVPRVGSGSILRLNVTPQDYEMPKKDGGSIIGASFQLNAAQIIKLVQGGSRTAADYGFGVEDDGDEIDESQFEPADDADGYTGDDGDGGNTDF